MKLLKKFSKGIIAVVMCLLLATTVLAAATATYTAELDDAVICVNELTEAKTVKLTAKVDEKVEMDAFTAQVKAPEGWEITDIANGNLNSTEFNFNLENGMILWYSSTANSIENDLLAEVTIQVPAGTVAGEYEIVFEIIDISRDWGMPWEDGEILTAKLTIADHADGDDADHECDTCLGDVGETCHGGTATCKDKAVCAECGQPYGDVNPNNHVGERTTTYTKNGDDHTVTVTCECGGVISTETVAHDFTNGDCVCGAEKPEEPVPGTGLKGDVNLDGVVDALDLAIMARVVPGIENLTDAQALINADVNEDGQIDAIDLAKFARFVPGIITDWSQD